MAIRIEKVKNRIHLKGWDGPGTPDKCKAIPGYSWLADKKAWSFPLDMSVCRDLRKAFGLKLQIGPELWEWANHERKMYDAQVERGTLDDVELVRLHKAAPVLAAAMDKRTYQKVGVSFMAAGPGILCADQPGLGKTLETLGAIIENGIPGPYLILAPKTAVHSVWYKQIKRWLAGGHYSVASCIGPSGSDRNYKLDVIDEFWGEVSFRPNEYHFLLCNIEMARKTRWYRCPTVPEGRHALKSKKCGLDFPHEPKEDMFEEPEFEGLYREPWAGIVVDESHLALVHSGGEGTQRRNGIVQLPVRAGGKRYALSGTPFRGKVVNLWGTLNWLRPELYTSRWRWMERYFQMSNNGYGTEVGELREDKMDDFYASLGAIMIRRTKGEVLKDLPDKQYEDIEIEMEGKQLAAYRAMEKDAIANIAGGELSAAGILAELTRSKQLATSTGKMVGTGQYTEFGTEIKEYHPALPSNKYDWILQFLEERGFMDGEGDSKVVIASQFTSLINVFAYNLYAAGVNSFRITGQVTERRRARYMEEFQSPQTDVRLMFINTKAGGVAIDLDAADELVFLDETWIPDDQEQVEDRVHRASRIHNVTIYRLRSADTIEARIAEINIARDQLQKTIMDGRRGVSLALRLLGEGK